MLAGLQHVVPDVTCSQPVHINVLTLGKVCLTTVAAANN